ncbi:MAG: hypothetical protein KQH63_15320 [Desulfobulbaceae bacterium]|nr:hypothetical protein [Desulfobulbaceae bacterium]
MSDTRANQVVDSSYLRSVVIKCTLVIIAGLMATAVIFYLMMKEPIGPTYGEGFRMLAQLDQEIFYKSLIIYGSTVLVALCCIVLMTMLYSHRVAGPIYRLGLFAGQIRNGDISTNVTLRRSDVIHPLALEMNNMADNFRQSLGNINQQIEELENQIALLEKDDQPRREILEKIGAGAEMISALTGKYKL